MTDAAARITIDTPIRFADKLPEAADITVIGGGVIGVFAALYLARLGKRVVLCEKGRIAGEQSSRNWGWIRRQGRDAAELPIMIRALELWHDANRETNGACGVEARGTLYLASTEKTLARKQAWLEIAKAHDLETRALSRAEAAGFFSGQAADRWIGGIYSANDARGEPFRAIPAVARLAQQSGVTIRENCAVRALDIAGGQLTGVVTEAGRIACDQVVLAAGVWSSLLARRHGISLPQLAVRSTVSRTEPMPEFFSSNAADEGLAIRRRQDGGYTLAGGGRHGFYLGPDAFRHFRAFFPQLKESWREIDLSLWSPQGYPDGWGTARRWAEDAESPFERMRVLEPAPNMDYVRRAVARFKERFPAVGHPRIAESWAGMIDAMPDVVPVVDRCPVLPGLIVATGMSGHGFGIGPGFGEVIARMATGQDPGFDLRRFRFSRFTDGSPIELGPLL